MEVLLGPEELAEAILYPFIDNVLHFLDKFSPLVQSTLLKNVSAFADGFSAIDETLNPAVDALGDARLVKYLLVLFLAVPLGAVMRAIPSRFLKNLFSLAGGVLSAQWVFEEDWIHAFVSSAVVYLICLLFPRSWCGDITMVFVMTYMTASHLYRMYVAYDSPEFDFTFMQMVLTMKLSSFAYNYSDGSSEYVKDINTALKSDRIKVGKKQWYSDRRFYALDALPNVLDYSGYVFCFTCIMAGPAFEYKDYMLGLDDVVNVEGRKIVVEDRGKKLKSEIKAMAKPASWPYGLYLLVQAICALACSQAIHSQWPLSLLSNEIVLAEHTMLVNFAHSLLILFAERQKYYFAWKIAESASVMAGFGFEGYDENNHSKGFDGVSNMDIVGFETATNEAQLARKWNKRTQSWLQRYSYHRLAKGNIFVLFIFSALWHGLYPGYFFFFLSAAFTSPFEKKTINILNAFFIPDYKTFKDEPNGSSLLTCPSDPKKGNQIYWILSWICTQFSFVIFVQPFSQRTLEKSLRTQWQYMWIPHISYMIAPMIFTVIFGKKKPKEKNV
jgi:hypothetical protein